MSSASPQLTRRQQAVLDCITTTIETRGYWVAPHQPLHRSLGLLDYQATRLRAHIAGNADTARDD